MDRRAGSFVLVAALLLGTGPGPAASGRMAAAGDPISVLVLSGQGNHDWRSTTPKLVSILKDAGRFVVQVTEDPGRLTAKSLRGFDVVVSNWNAYDRPGHASDWPEKMRRAYLAFVRGGKGHVVVHAGGASFPAWRDYLELVLATWQDGLSTHGPVRDSLVRLEPVAHPVTEGLEPFTITDEIWASPGLSGGTEVLASSFSAPDKGGSGRWEPSVLAGRYGLGRCLTILLGHDVAAMDNPGFRALLLRAAEWAATGRIAQAPAPARADDDPAGAWRWERGDGSGLALVGPHGPLWQFRYAPGLDYAYFHPLQTTDGRLLTWDRPPDHIWHHGLWFSWKYINKINYWEVEPATGRPAGRTSWSNVRVSTGPGAAARIDLDLDYRPAGEEGPVLTEKRTIEVRHPDEDGVYAIDWTCAFQAHDDARLDRTPLPGEPGGAVSGGYAGLSLRLAEDFADRQVMTSDGPVEAWTNDRYRGRHIGVDYSGLAGGSPAGIAVIDHPSNPRSPTPWYVINSPGFSWFTPAFLCYDPFVLRAGGTLVLRYRVLVHPGRWDAGRLRQEAARFSGQALRPATS